VAQRREAVRRARRRLHRCGAGEESGVGSLTRSRGEEENLPRRHRGTEKKKSAPLARNHLFSLRLCASVPLCLCGDPFFLRGSA
jgi:hypothetical protein